MPARERRTWLGAIAAAMLVAASLGACGEGRTFTAEEFVDEIGEQGVELRLGDELFTNEEGKELYEVELEPVVELPGEGDGEGEHGHTGGSLAVHDDTAGAEREIESCKMTADLLCYQIANIVVVLEGGGLEAQQLAVAMKRLGEEE